MPPESPNPASDLRGAGRLTVDAIIGVTDLVESVHRTITTFGGLIAGSRRERMRGMAGFVYNNIRTISGVVEAGLDAALARLDTQLGARESSATRDAVVGALHGVLGDYLAATDNPLAISMQLRRDGKRLETVDENLRRAVREADGRVLLMIHGSSATDRQWTRGGHDHGAALARDLGYVPIYLRYNSGRHVSENGADLTEKFERVVSELPEPIDLTILAHSMGGLVARSARHYGTAAGHRWIESLDNLVFVGTPHHGAPLERYGNYVDYLLELTPYSAPFSRLGKLRSAGITDLRYGNLLDADWEGRGRFERSGDRRHPVPLPDGVNCYAIAGTKRETTDDLGERFHWDGMVPVDSGLGHHDDPAFDLGIPAARQRVAPDNNHLGLLGSLEVYQPLKTWLGP